MPNPTGPKDDFEFKPLTEGLGFHKKTINLNEALPKPKTDSFHPQPPQTSLWTPALKEKDLLPKSVAVVVGKGLEPLAASWPASIFDSTMVLGLTLIFSAVVFAITGIDMANLMDILESEGTAQLGSLILLFAIFEIYTVACRTFFGRTVGESMFQCRLGTEADQERILYPLQVAWRSLVIALTGFIILPALSTFLDQDLAGLLSGLSLYSEKNDSPKG